MKEQDIQAKIIKYLSDQGWLVTKNIATSRKGTPDLTAMKDGRVFMIEVKKPGKELSPLQRVYKLQAKRHHGVDVIRADGLDDLENYLKQNEI